MKQTAVEWLQQALEDTILTHEQIMQTIGLFEQAKDIDAERAYDIYEKWFWDNLPSKSSSEGKLSQKEFYNRYFKMKQTAVEWLIGQLYAPCRGIPSHIIEQAKEMEKEQMIDWYATGQADTVNMYEQHLNKTFKTNEK
jgi:hypothetical protein